MLHKIIHTIRRCIQVLFLEFIVFNYVFTVPLKGLPAGMGSRMILSLLGVVVLVVYFFKKDDFNKIKVPRKSIPIYLSVLLLMLIVFISTSINNTSDFAFLKNASSFIFSMLSGYFIIWIFFQMYNKISFSLLAHYLLFAGLLQVIVSLLMFINPAIRELVLSFLELGDFTQDLISYSKEYRLICIGANPFPVGVALGFTLMLLAVLMKDKTKSMPMAFFYTLSFLLLLSIGAMIARTTLIGGALAILMLLIPAKIGSFSIHKSIYNYLFSLALITSFIICTILVLPSSVSEKFLPAFAYGFEVFVNYFMGEGAQSASTNELYTMFISPQSFKTYLIGDGLFADPTNPILYYMGSDIGYVRLVFYLGLPGLLLYFFIQLYPIWLAIRANMNHVYIYRFLILQCLFLFILNIKGLTDLFPLTILFFYIGNKQSTAVVD